MHISHIFQLQHRHISIHKSLEVECGGLTGVLLKWALLHQGTFMLSVMAFVLLVQVCSGELLLSLHWLSVWCLFILRETWAHTSFFSLFGSPTITPLTPFFKSPDVFLHPFNYSRGMHYLLGIMCFGFPILHFGVHASLPFPFYLWDYWKPVYWQQREKGLPVLWRFLSLGNLSHAVSSSVQENQRAIKNRAASSALHLFLSPSSSLWIKKH